jgi:hypothetical protein
MNATGLLWRVAGSSRCCPIYASSEVEGWQGGEHAEKPLGNRSKKDTDPGPRCGESRLPRGEPVGSRSSPGADSTPLPPAATPSPAGSGGPTPTGGEQEDDARRMRPAPAAQLRQLTERRGARLLPGEHAPAAKDSSSVGGKACAPPPGFRARS